MKMIWSWEKVEAVIGLFAEFFYGNHVACKWALKVEEGFFSQFDNDWISINPSWTMVMDPSSMFSS